MILTIIPLWYSWKWWSNIELNTPTTELEMKE
jgi:hypothetical protein